MATTVVPTSFKVLVKMVASAFYGGRCPPIEALPPEERERALKPQHDTTGLARVLLAALTERQWVKEDDLAVSLGVHPRMARRALRYLEEEQLLQREHRRETKRSAKKEAAALGQAIAEEDEALLKAQVVTYCALDYPRLVDALRYRLEAMRRSVKVRGCARARGRGGADGSCLPLQREERALNTRARTTLPEAPSRRFALSPPFPPPHPPPPSATTANKQKQRACENRDTVQRYRCTNDMCAAEFSSLDVDKLEVNFTTGTFSCGVCGSEIDQLIGAESGAAGYTGSTAERRAYVERMRAIGEVRRACGGGGLCAVWAARVLRCCIGRGQEGSGVHAHKTQTHTITLISHP